MVESPVSREFWDQRYRSGRTPWDAAGVPAPLGRYLATHPGRGASVLIPGCGSGYEVDAFTRAGYLVSAIDFSPAAVARARFNLGSPLADRVVEGDFFTHDCDEAPFDLIYERTFLCALPPEMWPAIAARSAALLKPSGGIVGVYFYGAKEAGPPFGLDPGEEKTVFAPYFVTIADRPISTEESLPLFAGHERWQERRRVAV